MKPSAATKTGKGLARLLLALFMILGVLLIMGGASHFTDPGRAVFLAPAGLALMIGSIVLEGKVRSSKGARPFGCSQLAGRAVLAFFIALALTSLLGRALSRQKIEGAVPGRFEVVRISAGEPELLRWSSLSDTAPPDATYLLPSGELGAIVEKLSERLDENCRPGRARIRTVELGPGRQSVNLSVLCDELRSENWYEATAQGVTPTHSGGYGSGSFIQLAMLLTPVLLVADLAVSLGRRYARRRKERLGGTSEERSPGTGPGTAAK